MRTRYGLLRACAICYDANEARRGCAFIIRVGTHDAPRAGESGRSRPRCNTQVALGPIVVCCVRSCLVESQRVHGVASCCWAPWSSSHRWRYGETSPSCRSSACSPSSPRSSLWRASRKQCNMHHAAYNVLALRLLRVACFTKPAQPSLAHALSHARTLTRTHSHMRACAFMHLFS